MILDDIVPTDARGRTTRKRSKFASIFRYASAIVRQLEIYDGSVVTGRRMKMGEIRGVQRRRRCQPSTVCVRYTTWSCTDVLVACSEDKKRPKKHVGGSAAICQYGNKAGCSLPLPFSPSPFLLSAFNALSLSLYLVRCRYKQAHNVGAKMPTDGIPVPSPRRPHALTHPEPLTKPPTMLAFIGFHRFSSVSRSA